MLKNRVVITGIGIISSIGNNCKSVLNSLYNIKSGIIFSKIFYKNNLKSNVYAPVKLNDLNIKYNKSFKFANNSSLYAYYSMIQAIKDSDLKKNNISNDMTGLIVGNGCYNNKYYNYKKTNIFNLIKNMPSNISAFLSEIFKIKGISYSISSACSTSSNCIGNSFEIIKNGKQNIIFAGGSDEISIDLSYQFDSFKLLSRNYNFYPKKSSRPYDSYRNGFVISEGSGILVLEELNHALERKAKIYAEIISYGFSTESINITLPTIDGEYKCIKNAIKKVNNLNIDYINTHATSTKIGDLIEILSIKKIFKYKKLPKMSSTKSITGHSLGASGVHSIIYTILMMNNNFIFPNINILKLDKRFKNINLVNTKFNYKNFKILTFMINNFAFGGTNVTLIFKKFNKINN